MSTRYTWPATKRTTTWDYNRWPRIGSALRRFALRLGDDSPDSRTVSLESHSGESGAHEARSASAPDDASDFEAFFRAHERAIFSYLYRMVGDEQAAYDLSQETFVRVAAL